MLTPKNKGLITRQQIRQNNPGFEPSISLIWSENFSEPKHKTKNI